MNCTQNDTFHICQRDCKPIQIALREAINHVEDNVATDLKTCEVIAAKVQIEDQ